MAKKLQSERALDDDADDARDDAWWRRLRLQERRLQEEEELQRLQRLRERARELLLQERLLQELRLLQERELQERERARALEEQRKLDRALQLALENGTSKLRRARVMVVGASRVGKTSLLKRLIGERFEPNEASTVGVEQDMIYTRDISKWRKKNDHAIHAGPTDELVRVTKSMASEFSEEPYKEGTYHSEHELAGRLISTIKSKVVQKARKASGDETLELEDQMTYHLWDFGGQYVYHITHPIFLTWRAVYVLVINLNKEISASIKDVHFWLKSIYAHAVKAETVMKQAPRKQSDEPSVILVGTHAGALKEMAHDQMNEIKKELTKTSYGHQVKHYFEVENSNERDPMIEKVREAIDEEMDQADFMNDEVPTRWVIFEDRIHQLVAERKFYLFMPELTDELQRLGIKDDEVEAILNMFHHFGKIVYYKDTDIIVLDPQWLNGVITKVIAVQDEETKSTLCDEWKKLEKQGVLTENLIDRVWTVDVKLKNELLKMMELFDLICEINEGDESRKCQRERSFFVPCLSKEQLHEREIKEGRDNFSFLIDFHGFLPVGFVHRLFVHIARWTIRKGAHMPRFRTEEMTFYVDARHQLVMKAIDRKDMQVTMMTVDQEASDINPSLMNEFLKTLESALYLVKERWARRITYTIGLRCENCLDHKYEHIKTIPLSDYLKKDLVCKDCDARIDTTTVRQVLKGSGRASATTSLRVGKVLSDVYFHSVAKDIGGEWFSLGVSLGISIPELQRIQLENIDIVQRTMVILQRWRVKSTKSDRQKVLELCQALTASERVDLSDRVESDSKISQKSRNPPEQGGRRRCTVL